MAYKKCWLANRLPPVHVYQILETRQLYFPILRSRPFTRLLAKRQAFAGRGAGGIERQRLLECQRRLGAFTLRQQYLATQGIRGG